MPPVRLERRALWLTAAFEVALACDLPLAVESARFGLVETVVGLCCFPAGDRIAG